MRASIIDTEEGSASGLPTSRDVALVPFRDFRPRDFLRARDAPGCVISIYKDVPRSIRNFTLWEALALSEVEVKI